MKMFGKTIPVLAIVAIVASAGLVSAALLSYYGKITMTADVKQSVLVDGQDYTWEITDVIPVDAPGGETFCFLHTLKNQASVPATVSFETIYEPVLEDGEITATYFKPLGYSQSVTAGDQVVKITVEDGDCHVTWTIDFPIEAPYDSLEGNG
ncbi:unnamed protein product, partial [marine sediment metagenome]